ncbi:MAG: DUF885 domain-containing protein [Lachnospiraceae bacterium]|jgi:uncharacterized protein (DUF885 family)|nr:DUF885 domain-containing protein [Lachnospiraceae bacterium]
MKIKQKCTAVLLGLCLVLSGALLSGCSPEKEQQAFDAFLQEMFADEVTSDTITLHYTLADPEKQGITPPEVTYGEVDFSEEGLAEAKKELEDSLKELEGFRYRQLTDEQKLNYDVVHELMQTELAFYDHPFLYEPFAYTSGVQANLPITLSEYKLYNQQDVEDYLQLIEQMPAYFQSYLDFERVKSEKGLFMAKGCAEEVIRQCSDFIATPEENLLIETFNDRVAQVPGLSQQQIEAYQKMNYDAVLSYVIPTYEEVIRVFKELQGTGKNELGLSHLEGGKEYYEYLLKSNVGTSKTPEEVIALLESAMEERLGELYAFFMEHQDVYYAYIEKEDIYGDLDPKEAIQHFQEVFSDRFPEIPPIEFKVSPVHKSLEASVSPAFYMTPAMDDYHNNSIYINGGTESMGSLWATFAHEGIPGHMYQFVYFLSQEPEPIRALLSFSGYQEGWATYVEMMSYDYYDFEDPGFATLERINGELNLLVSARLEIGINYEGWTLEETQTYLSDNGYDASAAEGVMEYVIAEPANYQMYCTGWLEFEELRGYAETALQERFDESEFHKIILEAGPCQFDVLKSVVENYVKG